MYEHPVLQFRHLCDAFRSIAVSGQHYLCQQNHPRFRFYRQDFHPRFHPNLQTVTTRILTAFFV